MQEFDAILGMIGDGVPDGEQYQRMSALVLDFPEARKLAGIDPFSPDYKPAAMDLYLSLRGRREQGYVAPRDEAQAGAVPGNIWTEVAPWSFRDATMLSEHVLAWGNILRHLNLPPGGTLLEYGPGSGQVLIIAARAGYRAHGVDINEVALAGIQAQAAHLGLQLETEQGEFGHGFGDHRFDAILFYEAFHHAFDFDLLLERLHARLNPGGRLLLCGEPVVSGICDVVPYPWGPRLDALSVFCMRRFGWMELGFTHEFLMEIGRRTGWDVAHHAFPECGRAAVYVFRTAGTAGQAGQAVDPGHVEGGGEVEGARDLEEVALSGAPSEAPRDAGLHDEIRSLRQEVGNLRASTSWRITRPLRAARKLFSARERD